MLLHPASPYCFTSSNFNWLRGPDLNRRPSGYEPDELPGCSTPRPWMRTILCSRFHATFFLPRSRIRHDFEQKQITKAYFLCKICVRERLLISLNAVVCYLRCALFFNLKKRTMKGRWVKYLLMGTVVAMLAACSSKPTDRGQQYKDGKFTQPFSLVTSQMPLARRLMPVILPSKLTISVIRHRVCMATRVMFITRCKSGCAQAVIPAICASSALMPGRWKVSTTMVTCSLQAITRR